MMMKGYRIKLIVLLAALTLVSCGIKKQTVVVEPEEPVAESAPAWHTCLQSARAIVYTETNKIAANVTMQTVRDSMIIISVMPMLGIEMARLEATPLDLIAIDKMHGQYTKVTFAELNRKLTPSLNWDVLQQVATGELPTGEEKARLLYSFGEETIELVIEYSPRKTDVPVRMMNQNLNRYTQVDVTKWL